jgi:hypothetical protein
MSPVDASLVGRIRQSFDAGVLPRERPKYIWRSYGVGDACSACGNSMLPGQDVVELDIVEGTHRLHIDCYGLWEGELISRGLFRPQ